ncbi:hypothetical protein BASA81_017883 [Batrachochytrium salamandrivorans]|nr:hypothetical protein BASA81_017883 [Batrachochytrium salamandrivorans]
MDPADTFGLHQQLELVFQLQDQNVMTPTGRRSPLLNTVNGQSSSLVTRNRKPSPTARNRPDSLREPKTARQTSSMAHARNFRGFINQLELVFQLQDRRYDSDRKKIATLGTLLTDKALSWYNPYIETGPSTMRTTYPHGRPSKK